MSGITPYNIMYFYNSIRSRIKKDGMDTKYVQMTDSQKKYDLDHKGTTKNSMYRFNNAERCVCCGVIVPEGREICPVCENNSSYS